MKVVYRPTAKGYFSGCGGMELGLQLAGLRMVQSLDLDPTATECMERNRHYFPHKILNCDIKEKMVLEQPPTDVIVGTYPCTRYSSIADISGTRTGDDLFLHFFRHIAIEKPEAYVVENVPGMKKLKVVMEAMTQLPDYYVQVFCPVDASSWLPQKRKRLILIGTRKYFMASAPGVSRVGTLKEMLDENPDVQVPDSVISRLQGKYRDKPIIVDPEEPGAIAPTCVAHYAKDMGTRLVKDPRFPHGVRPFTRREYARLQGFPDDFWLPNSQAAYRLVGNAVPVHMGEWAGLQLMKYFN